MSAGLVVVQHLKFALIVIKTTETVMMMCKLNIGYQSDYGPEQNYIRIEANLEIKARNQAP